MLEFNTRRSEEGKTAMNNRFWILLTAQAHIIGAIFYILWGIIHIWIGATTLYSFSISGGRAVLLSIGSAVPPNQIPQIIPGIADGILAQHSWNLLWFGVFALIVGAALNWKNSKTGYWFNLGVVSAADLGFVFAVLIPGYIKFFPAIIAPVFWIAAAIFSTIGLFHASANPRD